MDDLECLWKKYNEYSNKLAAALGRTSNLVGEYGEYLAHKHYGGRLLDISGSSADIKADDGTLYQVKSRKIKGSLSTQLNVIRSWSFDFLVVILYSEKGKVMKAIEVSSSVAKEHATHNVHQNGWIITTNQRFMYDARSRDITHYFVNPEQLSEPAKDSEVSQDWLTRSLKSVGQSCFVQYFHLFNSEDIDPVKIIETLKRETNYTKKSCASRTSHVLRTCRLGRSKEVLQRVVGSRSSHVTDETRESARSILANMR